MAEFSDYAWLVGDEAAAWLARLADDLRPALQQLESLRSELPAQRARLLVEQVELRRRATAKFGALASEFFFTPLLLQQATDICIAGYKTTRFLPFGEDLLVNDYCCGIGGDLAILATHGRHAGWDVSEVACLLASANLEVMGSVGAVHQADVSELTPTRDEAWHVDPDRRAGGVRTTTLARHSPGPEVIDRWRQSSPNGAVKLAPAAEPPAEWLPHAELEWISSGGECRQLVVWFGELAKSRGMRRATRVISDGIGGRLAGSIAGMPSVPCDAVETPYQYLYDADPSVLAAKLLGELAVREGLAKLGAGGSYLTSDRATANPLVQGFAVEDCMPLRTAEIRKYLSARGVGRAEIKKRGVAVDPEKLRRELKLRGDNEATVVLTRIGKREVALICKRMTFTPGVNEAAAGS